LTMVRADNCPGHKTTAIKRNKRNTIQCLVRVKPNEDRALLPSGYRPLNSGIRFSFSRRAVKVRNQTNTFS
jgi:hypothetical protein